MVERLWSIFAQAAEVLRASDAFIGENSSCDDKLYVRDDWIDVSAGGNSLCDEAVYRHSLLMLFTPVRAAQVEGLIPGDIWLGLELLFEAESVARISVILRQGPPAIGTEDENAAFSACDVQNALDDKSCFSYKNESACCPPSL
jgi:hypothetical protein